MIKNHSFTKVILISELTQIFNVFPPTLEFFQIHILLERGFKNDHIKIQGCKFSNKCDFTLGPANIIGIK